MVSRGLLKRLMSSKGAWPVKLLIPFICLLNPCWKHMRSVPRTEAVFRGENFRPPHPLYAELHLCFVFSVFLSISTFQWAYYLNTQYQSVLVTSTSFSLYFLGSSEHWGCHKNVLSNNSMDFVHNAFCNERMAAGLAGRKLKLRHSFPPWGFQAKSAVLSDIMMDLKPFMAYIYSHTIYYMLKFSVSLWWGSVGSVWVWCCKNHHNPQSSASQFCGFHLICFTVRFQLPQN